jgi:membrane protein DedA with SNARE-associated domain
MGEILQFFHDIWQTLRSGGFPDLGWWSYLLLMLLAATEGPFSVLLGAAAASAGYLHPGYVYLAAVTGNLLGDTVWYLIGYSNKTENLHRFGRYVGVHPEHIDKLKVAIRAHATKLILLAKFSISLMIPTLVAAGLARVPFRRWFPMVFLIELLWTGLLVWIGYHTTYLITNVEHWLAWIGAAFVLILIASVVRYVRRLIQQEEEQVVAPPVLPLTTDRTREPESPRPKSSHLYIALDAERPAPVYNEPKQL